MHQVGELEEIAVLSDLPEFSVWSLAALNSYGNKPWPQQCRWASSGHQPTRKGGESRGSPSNHLQASHTKPLTHRSGTQAHMCQEKLWLLVQVMPQDKVRRGSGRQEEVLQPF